MESYFHIDHAMYPNLLTESQKYACIRVTFEVLLCEGHSYVFEDILSGTRGESKRL